MNLGGIPNSGGWFPLSKKGLTPSHLLITTVSLRLGHSLRRHFIHSPISISSPLKALQLQTRNLNGWNTTGNEGGFSQDMSIRNPSPRRRWTTVLLAVNMLVYVAQMATQGKLMLWGAKMNSQIDKGQLWRLVTSSFLHANIGHLMMNCYSLNSFGPTVENICGTQRFFTIYFASAVASGAMSYWLCDMPAVGASGAIFGLVGSVAVFSLRHRSLLSSGERDLQDIAQFIFLNMMIGLLSTGIDNWGHLGGLVGGAAISWLIGPAWKYQYTHKDGRRVFADKPPISSLPHYNSKRDEVK